MIGEEFVGGEENRLALFLGVADGLEEKAGMGLPQSQIADLIGGPNLTAKGMGGSAVGIFAILHAIDTQSVGIRIGKTDTPLAYAEAIFWRIDTLELFDVAYYS